MLLIDNAPFHPPLAEMNIIKNKIEIIYLPPNITAMIQPMDQGLILLTKNHKKFFLRNLLLADKLVRVDFFQKFKLPRLLSTSQGSWETLTNSTLQKIWKPSLGDCQL